MPPAAGDVVNLLLALAAMGHRPHARWVDAALARLQEALAVGGGSAGGGGGSDSDGPPSQLRSGEAAAALPGSGGGASGGGGAGGGGGAQEAPALLLRSDVVGGVEDEDDPEMQELEQLLSSGNGGSSSSSSGSDASETGVGWWGGYRLPQAAGGAWDTGDGPEESGCGARSGVGAGVGGSNTAKRRPLSATEMPGAGPLGQCPLDKVGGWQDDEVEAEVEVEEAAAAWEGEEEEES